MLLCYKIWKKYNEIQLTKNKLDLNNVSQLQSVVIKKNDYYFIFIIFTA